MALQYSDRLRLALATAMHAKAGSWPEAWGEATEKEMRRRIAGRRKIAKQTEPVELHPHGVRYTNALYDYAVLRVRSRFNPGRGSFGKLQHGRLSVAHELQPIISAWLAREKESSDDTSE